MTIAEQLTTAAFTLVGGIALIVIGQRYDHWRNQIQMRCAMLIDLKMNCYGLKATLESYEMVMRKLQEIPPPERLTGKAEYIHKIQETWKAAYSQLAYMWAEREPSLFYSLPEATNLSIAIMAIRMFDLNIRNAETLEEIRERAAACQQQIAQVLSGMSKKHPLNFWARRALDEETLNWFIKTSSSSEN